MDPTPAATRAALRSIQIIATGDRADFEETIAPGAVNHEAAVEPPGCRVGGPSGFHATSRWLRAAFAELDHRVHHVVAQDDLVVVDTTMSGRHTGPFVLHDGQGEVDRVWAPTGRSFAVRQTHWLRVRGDMVTEHWAARDDLGQGLQLGWVPPTPGYLVRCAVAKRHAVRAARSRGVAAGVLVLLLAGLAGCGSSSQDGGSDAASAASSLLPSDLRDATSGDTNLDGEADAGAGLTAEQLCGFLATEAPEVVDLQPAEYAAAVFGQALVAFYSQHGLLTDIDGAEMDALAAEGCPSRARALLPVLGTTSFADLP